MRCKSAIAVVAVAVSACGSNGNADDDGQLKGTNGDSGSHDAGGGDADAADSGERSDGGLVLACSPVDSTDAGADETPTAPLRAVAGAALPLGVTETGYIVYRADNRIFVQRIAGGEAAREIAPSPGTVSVKGKLVFHWSALDYEAGLGDLSVWSGGDCLRQLGRTLLDESSVVTNSEGSSLLYATNVSTTTFDLALARADFSYQYTLARGIGRASPETCRAQYGFAGERIVVSACTPGNLEATLTLYTRQGDAWEGASASTPTTGAWASDRLGQRVFYTSSRSQAYYWDVASGSSQLIDEGVAWGVFMPSGSALLYTVGDQLRRTALPEIVPIPIVTNKFRHLASFSPDLSYALYSTSVTYEEGEKRDLLLTGTHGFNPTPAKLVATPAARLSRSAFSDDGEYVLYLSALDAQAGSTLHVRRIGTGEERTFDAVDTLASAGGSRIVFSSHRSDPTSYPILARLQLFDASSPSDPVVLQAEFLDGRSFYVTSAKDVVVYARPRNGSDTSSEGIWVRPLDQ